MTSRAEFDLRARISDRWRPDIQGLRAVAVLLVALDHARVGPFHGGFVGVDVFFVISGFLITSLLLGEAERSGRVSLLDFYARRARRILPASTLVIVVTAVAAVLLLPGVHALRTVEQAFWATFFAANVKLAADGTDYFNSGAAASPLQHYWSLAVEEQFYLVWPVLFLVICLAARPRGGPADVTGVRRTAVPVLAAVILVSFAWSVFDTPRHPLAAYFAASARAWELGVGALAACVAPRLVAVPRGALAVGSWLGLAAVGWAAVAFDGATPFPGHAAALPVAGTALLLVGGLRAAPWGPQPALSMRPLRVVGDWSYSFYLWHWPVLILVPHGEGQRSGASGLVLLGVALGLAGLTYHYVENPLRRSSTLALTRLRGVLMYPAVVVLTLPLLMGADRVIVADAVTTGPPITAERFGQQPGDPRPRFSRDPVVALVQASVRAARNDVAIPGGLDPSPIRLIDDRPSVGACGYSTMDEDERRLCPRGDLEAGRSLVVLGDSHARQWIPALDVLTARHGYTAYYLVREGCPGYDVTPWREHGTGPAVDCADFQDWAVKRVEEVRPDLVLLASEISPHGLVDDNGQWVRDWAGVADLFRAGMRRQFERLAPFTDRMVVIGDPPALRFDPGSCLTARDASLATCLSTGAPRSLLMTDAVRRATREAGIDFVETGRWFCAYGECPAVIGHFISRRDPTHVAVPYSAYLADHLGREIGLVGDDAG